MMDESGRAVEAVLQSGAVETPYVRAGSGGAVLLLQRGSLDEMVGSEIFRELAARFRVTGAVPPENPDEGWLRDLIDGLGLDRPQVVAEAALASFVRGFAAAHPERVAGIEIREARL